MKKLITILSIFLSVSLSSQIPKDKQLHFVAGTAIGFWSSICPASIEMKPLPAIGIAVGAATFVGVTKELVYDKWMHKGTPNVKDALFTVAGGVAGYLLVRGFVWTGKKLESLIRRHLIPRYR